MIGFILGKILLVSVCMTLGPLLYNLLSPLLHKEGLSSEALDLINQNLFFFTVFFIISSLFVKVIFDRWGSKLVISWLANIVHVGVNVVFYWLFFKHHGMMLKTFSIFTGLLMMLGTLLLSWGYRLWCSVDNSLDQQYSIYRLMRRAYCTVNDYFRDRPSAILVIPFMVMMIFCAILIAMEHEMMAERIANGAYISIVFGVLLDLVHLMTHRSSLEDDTADSERHE